MLKMGYTVYIYTLVYETFHVKPDTFETSSFLFIFKFADIFYRYMGYVFREKKFEIFFKVIHACKFTQKLIKNVILLM